MKILLLCLAAGLLLATLGATTKKEASKEEIVQLEPLRVSTSPINSYPLELEVRLSKTTRRVLAVVIVGVEPDSEAEAADLRPGDEIIKINGRDVVGMDGRVNLQADLAKLLIDRPVGETIRFEVLTKRTKTVTLHSGVNVKPPIK